MTIFLDIGKELLGMFLADLRLTVATLALVALIACLTLLVHASSLLCGTILLIGCVAVVIEAAVREARKRNR